MHTLEDSPADGLVATFFTMAERRGFFVLPEHDEKRALLEFDLRSVINGLIESGSIEVKNLDDDATSLLFKLEEEDGKPGLTECPLLQALSKNELPDFPKGAEVTRQDLDRFTICFACACAQRGLSGAHYIETLNEVRCVVAHGLQGLGHVVPDEHLLATPGRSMWARHDEWACLAESVGVDETVIKTVVHIAQASSIAA